MYCLFLTFFVLLFILLTSTLSIPYTLQYQPTWTPIEPNLRTEIQESTVFDSICGNDLLLDEYSLHQETSQQNCPIQTDCDIPSIRDLYTNFTLNETRRITIEMAVELGTTFATVASQRASALVADLNLLFGPHGFQFNLSLILYGPIVDSETGNPIGNWFVHPQCTLSPLYSQPCIDHVALANLIFENRGGFLKNNTLVIVVAQTQRQLGSNLRVNGFAYFPWMPNHGLMVAIPEVVGPGLTTIAHETGHSLGLWHVHRGTFEVLRNDFTTCPFPIPACYERVANDTVGDFCDDTGPFPSVLNTRMRTCTVPTMAQEPDPCDATRQSWSSDGVNNLMSYMPNQCRNQFSIKQARRMRCYFDRYGYPNRNSAIVPPNRVSIHVTQHRVTASSTAVDKYSIGIIMIILLPFFF